MARQPATTRESDLDAISQSARERFVNNFRGPTVSRTVQIGAAPIQGHFKRYYYHTLNNSHIALYVGRAHLEHTKVNKVEEGMLAKIAEVAKFFASRAAQADAIIKAQGIEEDVENLHPSSQTTAIVVGPVAMRYLTLITDADKLYSKYVLLWTMGEITGEECNRRHIEIKRSLKSVVRTIEQLRVGVLNAINESKSRDAEGLQVPAASDLATLPADDDDDQDAGAAADADKELAIA